MPTGSQRPIGRGIDSQRVTRVTPFKFRSRIFNSAPDSSSVGQAVVVVIAVIVDYPANPLE
jgi:hypothetical protein